MNVCRYASVAVFAVGVALMASTPLDAQGTLPGAPRNFVAGVAGFTISLAWEAPLVGVPVDDYVLQFGLASGIYDIYNGSIGPLTSLSFPVPPGTYYFRVIAVNAVGPGPPTSEVSVIVGDPLPTTLPSAPQTLTATAVGSQLTVSWAAPATGGPITGYILQAGSASGVYNFYNGPYGTVTSLSAAAPDGVYYFRVIAQNAVGQGPPSSEVSVTVGIPAPTVVPSAPQTVTATAVGSLLTVSWAAPATGGPITGYILQAGSASGVYNFYNGPYGTVTSLSAAAPDGVYYFRVIAQNAVGQGPPSSEVSVTVGIPAPTVLPSAPQTVTATAVGSTLTVSWAAPATGGPITGYILQAGSASGVYNFYNGPYGAVTSLSAAAPDGVYYFRVIAQNVVGQGPPSNEVSVTVGIPAPTVLPSAPQTVTATAVGSTLTVSWAAPATGGPITGYILQVGSASGAYNFYNGPYGTVTSLSVAAPDGVYYFRVIAQNVVGQGPPSNEVSVTVGIPAPTVLPSAPQMLTATAVGSTLTVGWAAPATGGPITGYILQAGSASGVYNFYNGPYGTVTSLSAAAPDGVYYFRVIAQNVVGQGPPSNEVSVTVGIPQRHQLP